MKAYRIVLMVQGILALAGIANAQSFFQSFDTDEVGSTAGWVVRERWHVAEPLPSGNVWVINTDGSASAKSLSCKGSGDQVMLARRWGGVSSSATEALTVAADLKLVNKSDWLTHAPFVAHPDWGAPGLAWPVLVAWYAAENAVMVAGFNYYEDGVASGVSRKDGQLLGGWKPVLAADPVDLYGNWVRIVSTIHPDTQRADVTVTVLTGPLSGQTGSITGAYFQYGGETEPGYYGPFLDKFQGSQFYYRAVFPQGEEFRVDNLDVRFAGSGSPAFAQDFENDTVGTPGGWTAFVPWNVSPPRPNGPVEVISSDYRSAPNSVSLRFGGNPAVLARQWGDAVSDGLTPITVSYDFKFHKGNWLGMAPFVFHQSWGWNGTPAYGWPVVIYWVELADANFLEGFSLYEDGTSSGLPDRNGLNQPGWKSFLEIPSDEVQDQWLNLTATLYPATETTDVTVTVLTGPAAGQSGSILNANFQYGATTAPGFYTPMLDALQGSIMYYTLNAFGSDEVRVDNFDVRYAGSPTALFHQDFDTDTAGMPGGWTSLPPWNVTPAGFGHATVTADAASSPPNSLEWVGHGLAPDVVLSRRWGTLVNNPSLPMRVSFDINIVAHPGGDIISFYPFVFHSEWGWPGTPALGWPVNTLWSPTGADLAAPGFHHYEDGTGWLPILAIAPGDVYGNWFRYTATLYPDTETVDVAVTQLTGGAASGSLVGVHFQYGYVTEPGFYTPAIQNAGLMGTILAGTAFSVRDKVLVDNLKVEVVTPCGEPRQDADRDGDVDVNDFAVFQACFNGASNPWPPEADQAKCACLDGDDDHDVDVNDFAIFQSCFNGASRPPACP